MKNKVNLKNLEILKHRVATDKNLAGAYDYFLTNFGDIPAFMDVGERTEDPLVDKFIEAIGQQLYGPRTKSATMLLVKIAEYHFIHGACLISGRMANVIYFQDIQVGMVAIVPSKQGQPTQFSRFSGRQLPADYFGSDN